MQLLRLGPVGQERPAVADENGTVYDLTGVTRDIDGAFLENDGIAKARAALAAGLPVLEDAATLRVGAPIAKPGVVLCIGQNYAAHAAESGNAAPTVPIIFFKHPNTVIGAFDDIVFPRGATELDWEVELGIVIGKRTSYLDSVEDAAAHIAGYVVAHDVSERVWQKEISGGQWSKGKTAETFCPVGPALVPENEVANVQALRIWSQVNGEKRQDSNTADMVFSAAHLIWNLSQFMVLDAGDLVITGTPEGVAMSGRFPFLKVGDTVELGVEGLGVQKQTVVASR